MTFGHDSDPIRPDLRLSMDELQDMHRSLSELAILKGDIIRYEGMFPVTVNGPEPHSFRLPLEPGAIAAIHMDDGESIAAYGSYIEHAEAHRIDPLDENPFSPTREDVKVRFVWRMAESNIQRIESYIISNVGGLYNGTVDTAYYENDQLISPNNLARSKHRSTEEIIESIEDSATFERPMGHDDRELLDRLKFVVGWR